VYLFAETTPALSNLEVLYLFQKLVDDGAPVAEIEWANVHTKSSLPCTVLVVFSDWSPLKFCYLTYQRDQGDHRLPPRLSCISRHRRHMQTVAAIDRGDRVRGAAIAPVDSNWLRLKSTAESTGPVFAAFEDCVSRSKDICTLSFFTGESYISLLVHYLCAQRAEFPHLALLILEEGLEFNRSARGGATVVGQGHYQAGVTWLSDAVIRE